jgi:hypothetical protein
MVAMGVAAALATTCVAGATLYVSSTGSQTVQDQLAHTCAGDSALRLVVPRFRGGELDPELLQPWTTNFVGAAKRIGSQLVGVRPPVVSQTTTTKRLLSSGSRTTMVVVTRDGADLHVDPPLRPLKLREIAMTESNLRIYGLAIGDQVTVVGSGQNVHQPGGNPVATMRPSMIRGHPCG